MKITIAKAALGRELAYLQQYSMEKKGTFTALSYLRLEAISPRRLTLAATDLDLTLTCETEATVTRAGVCLLPGRKLTELVRHLPDAPLTLTTNAHQRTDITCGPSQCKMAGLAEEDFPTLPTFPAVSASLPARIAQTLINRTRFAVTAEESRYMLAGVQFTLSPQGVRCVATDGHRLALAENTSVVHAESLACLIPKKALSALSQLAAGHDGSVGLHLANHHLYAEIGPRTLVCRLLTGEFPDYQRIVPAQLAHQVEFDAPELRQAVRRVAVMATERVRAVGWAFSRGQLRLFTPADAEGAAEETLSANYDGPPVTLNLNAQYVTDYLTVVGQGRLLFGFNTPYEVVQLTALTPVEGPAFALIMPLAVPYTAAPPEVTPTAAAPEAAWAEAA